MAFTLRPDTTFAFDPVANGYLINFWFFFFRGDSTRAFFQTLECLAGEFIHEYDHRTFFFERNMLGRDGKVTAQFIKEFHDEIEERARSVEEGFLQKAISYAQDEVNVNSFCVKEWSESGIPICEVKKEMISPKGILNLKLIECKSLREKVLSLSNGNFKSADTQNKNEWYSQISKALKLNEPSSDSQIIEIQ